MEAGDLDTDSRPSLLETYLAQRDALKRFLTARTGSAEEAEDLVQEMYFRLDREAVPDDIKNPAAYLYRVALNLAHDRRRERRRTQRRDGQWAESRGVVAGSEPVADAPGADAAYAARQRLTRLVAALDNLSPQCRRVFVLHKFEGLSHSDIAQRVGISRSTVEKHMGTALRHLSRLVEDG